jgi:hypothetical protein
MDKRFLIHRLVCCRGSQSTHHHGPVLMCVLSRPGIKQIEKIETKKKGGRNRTIPSSRWVVMRLRDDEGEMITYTVS